MKGSTRVQQQVSLSVASCCQSANNTPSQEEQNPVVIQDEGILGLSTDIVKVADRTF